MGSFRDRKSAGKDPSPASSNLFLCPTTKIMFSPTCPPRTWPYRFARYFECVSENGLNYHIGGVV